MTEAAASDGESRDALTRMADRQEQVYFGKYRGIVEDNRDPEQLGRLKLRVPSLLGDCVTDWAWPCLPYGGLADQGFFVIPDPGAKVWAEFEEGNLDLPIWVGTFWSKPGGATEIPAEAQDMVEDEPARRVWKTSSGHVIELADTPDGERIAITHKDGARVTLDEKGSVVIANKTGTLIYLNAEDAELTAADENGNNVRMGDTGIAVTNKDGSLVDLCGDAVQVVAKSVHVRSETVSLGEGAMEPALLGTTFAAIFDAHVHPTAMGPSGPPVPAPSPLSVPTSMALSKAVRIK